MHLDEPPICKEDVSDSICPEDDLAVYNYKQSKGQPPKKRKKESYHVVSSPRNCKEDPIISSPVSVPASSSAFR